MGGGKYFDIIFSTLSVVILLIKVLSIDRFSTKLQLSVADRTLMCVSHLATGIQEAIYDISNATSHSLVSASLQRLLMYLVISQGHPGSSVKAQGHQGSADVFSLEMFTNIAR